MNIEPEIVAALIGGSVAVLATILTNLFLRKKNDAEASLAISQAVANLIEPLNERIEFQGSEIETLTDCVDKQEEEIKSLKLRLVHFLDGIKRLVVQLRKQGCEPVWTPDELAVKKRNQPA